MPSVNRLYREFKGNGLEVLLVTFRESAAPVKKTAQERGYTAPILLDASGDVTGRVYGVWGPPTAYLIDRQGRIQGARDWSAPAARNLPPLPGRGGFPLALAVGLVCSTIHWTDGGVPSNGWSLPALGSSSGRRRYERIVKIAID